MKYTVIVGDMPYTVVAAVLEEKDGLITFSDMDGAMVAEVNANKVSGIIWEDNNVTD